MIDFEHVYKTYETHNDENVALEDINIHIDEGEFVFILGHSGAGKSTFLKLIQMEEKPTEGKVFINGQDLTRIKRRKVPYLRRQMGVVFQDFRLIPTMTVYENVAFAMRVTNISTKKIKDRVPFALSLVGLEDKMDRLPDELSGGEQQRVSIARALAKNPKLLLCNLDHLVDFVVSFCYPSYQFRLAVLHFIVEHFTVFSAFSAEFLDIFFYLFRTVHLALLNAAVHLSDRLIQLI